MWLLCEIEFFATDKTVGYITVLSSGSLMQ